VAPRSERLLAVGALKLCAARDDEDKGACPLLLIGGLGMQLTAWPAGFLDALAEAGFAPIVYDHRDTGRSTVLAEAGAPDLLRALRRDRSRLAYGLEELADDAAGLLGALGVPRAHVLGISMGAMVAQLVALRHPDKVLSLCSMMGSTGRRGVGQASNAALAVLLRGGQVDEDGAVALRITQRQVTAGPNEAIDASRVEAAARAQFQRGHHAEGSARQLAAILAAEDRTEALGTLSVPTLVVHGDADEMVDPSGGVATAEAVPGARLLMVPGMGHGLPSGRWEELVRAITANAGVAG